MRPATGSGCRGSFLWYWYHKDELHEIPTSPTMPMVIATLFHHFHCLRFFFPWYASASLSGVARASARKPSSFKRLSSEEPICGCLFSIGSLLFSAHKESTFLGTRRGTPPARPFLTPTLWSGKPPECDDLRSGGLGHIGGLRPFLSLDNLKLHLVALLQALVAFGGDGAVMNEHIRSIVTAEEAVSFGVVEPLHGALQTFRHVRPLFLANSPGKGAIPRAARNVQELCCSPGELSRLGVTHRGLAGSSVCRDGACPVSLGGSGNPVRGDAASRVSTGNSASTAPLAASAPTTGCRRSSSRRECAPGAPSLSPLTNRKT